MASSEKIIGNYRIIEMIAEGGFGKTYKAEHLISKKLRCIKHCSRVSAEDDNILIEEAQAVWDLHHSSIPGVHDLLRLDDGSLALVMSYIPGLTLEQIVEKAGRMRPIHVAWIAERMLNVLNYLRWNGRVHGDIKPQNIIIQPKRYSLFLVDFGLSSIRPTSTSGTKGHTPYFAPPEQINGSPLVPESDLYSLGMTMIYALSGSMEHVRRKEIPADVPGPLCEFFRRLTVRQVALRPKWEEEDLFKTMQKLRSEVFPNERSHMDSIPGLE